MTGVVYSNSRLTQDNNIEIVVQIQKTLPALVFAVSGAPRGGCVYTQPRHLRAVAFYCRNSTALQASTLVDLCVVDTFITPGRFTVKYILFSTRLSARFTLSFCIDETGVVPSLAAPFVNAQRIFASAG
jgi:NADH:ubiquinone oxidoreductase subunit C